MHVVDAIVVIGLAFAAVMMLAVRAGMNVRGRYQIGSTRMEIQLDKSSATTEAGKRVGGETEENKNSN